MKTFPRRALLCGLFLCFPGNILSEKLQNNPLRSIEPSSLRAKSADGALEPAKLHSLDPGHPTNSHGPQYHQTSGQLKPFVDYHDENRKASHKIEIDYQSNLKHHRTPEKEHNFSEKLIEDIDIEDGEDEYKPSKHMENKQNYIKSLLVRLLERSEGNRNFAEILPILKVMSPAQRLAMASLVTKQITADKKNPRMNLAQVKSMFGNNSNITADLMLPIMLDIANLFRAFKDYQRKHDRAPQAQLLRRSFSDAHDADQTLDQTNIAQMISYSVQNLAQLKEFNKMFKNENITESVEANTLSSIANTSRGEDGADSGSDLNNKTSDDSKTEDPRMNNATKIRSNSTSEDLPVAEKLRYGRPPWARRPPPPPPRRRPATEPRRRQAEQPRPPLDPTLCDLFTDTLCLDTSDYPIHAISTSIRKNPNAMGVLHTDFPDISADSAIDGVSTKQENTYTPEHYLNNVHRREDGLIRPAEASGFMCPSVVKYARPQKARATSGEWKYIVNTGEHTQTLRLEKCLRPKDTCTYLTDNFKSKCVQVYNYHRLLTWDNQNGLHMDIFKVPTCCSCHIDGYSVSFPPHTNRPSEITSERFPGQDLSESERNPFESVQYSIRRPPPKEILSAVRDGNHDFVAQSSFRQPSFQENSPTIHDVKYFPIPNQFPNANSNFHKDIFQQQETNIRNVKKPFRDSNAVDLPSFLEPPSKPPGEEFVKPPDINQKYKTFGSGHHKRGTPGAPAVIMKRPVRKPIRKKNTQLTDDQLVGASEIQETPTIINAESFDDINHSIDDYEESSPKTIPKTRTLAPNTNTPPKYRNSRIPTTTDRQFSVSTKPEHGTAILKDISLNRRVNYNYHPIIDFFEEGQKEESEGAEDRSDSESSRLGGKEESDWRPMAGPMAFPLKALPHPPPTSIVKT